MKIYTLIQTIKANSGSVWNGREICADTTRDKVLWGDAGQECTGIISTCYASPAVIKKAMELGCNFIVVHEALFWNHGDRTDWLEKNTAFRKKKALLEESGVCIWRYHDYVHAGIRVDGALHDGIFYGLSSLLGVSTLADTPAPAWQGIGILAALLLLHFGWQKWKGKAPSPIAMILVSAVLGMMVYH